MSASQNGDWPTVELRDALLSLRNGIFVSRPAATGPGIPIYRISAVRPMALNVNDVRFAPDDTKDSGRFLVEEGDLLFTRYSGNAEYVGACAVVPEGGGGVLHPDKLIRGVVNRDIADPSFIELACSAGRTWSEIRSKRKTTAGQVGIAGKELGQVHIPLPPLDEQLRIVAHVRGRLRLVEAAEKRLRAALAKAAMLRRSVLAEAFPN